MDFRYGTILTNIPQGFVPPETWPEYGLIAGPPAWCTREAVPGGLRWSLWPLTFEQYIGDAEPDPARANHGALALNRAVMWRRIGRRDVPRGWRQFSKRPEQVDGYRVLGADPTAGFTKHARHDLRRWQAAAESTHTLEQVSIEEYEAAYRQSVVARRAGTARVVMLKRKVALPATRGHLELWGVRERASGKLLAGMALICSPTSGGSTHFAPFMLAEARAVCASTGLMHHWFVRAKEKGCTFAVTTNFWMPGKPKSWQGFSEFKSHFGWSYISYPPLLWRFVRGKLF